jgi:hypothetical protein
LIWAEAILSEAAHCIALSGRRLLDASHLPILRTGADILKPHLGWIAREAQHLEHLGSVVTHSIPTMTSREFATAFALRPNLVAWFLGAGASAASGIPTGYNMIRDFKAEIFCRHEGIAKREIDSGDQVWIARMDQFFRRTSILPPDGDPTEYAAAFELVYPQERHRRQYIADKVSVGTPCYGHKVLGSMLAAGKVDCVFTTNFDQLIEDAEQKRPTVAAIDSGQRAMRCLGESDWPLIAKLHGDYQSEAMKNTWAELEKQDSAMEHVLVEAGKRFGFAFVGYSGRDASVMQALAAVLKYPKPFPNGLYWVSGPTSKLLPAVADFLTAAHHAGVDVNIVECPTFDELASDVLKHVNLPKVLFDPLDKGRPTPRLVKVSLPAGKAQDFPVLRYSALLVDSLPQVARRVVLTQSISTPDARALLREHNCKAPVASIGRELAVFGKDEEIASALAPVGGKLAGTIQLNPAQDSWALGLLYDALTKALSRRRPLMPRFKRVGHSLLVSGPRENEKPEWAREREQALAYMKAVYEANLVGAVPKLDFPYHEGVFVKLEQIEHRWWCGFEPYTFVDIPRELPERTSATAPDAAEEDALTIPSDRRGGDPAGDWRRERWATRYNKQWASIINAWAKLLTGSDEETCRVCAYGLNEGEGVDAVFTLSKVTAWSRPGQHHTYFDRTR